MNSPNPLVKANPRIKLPSLIKIMREQVIPFLLRHRRAVVLLLVISVLLVELVEHLIISIYGEQVHFFFDTAVYLVLVPAGAWLALSILDSTETERKRANDDNDLRSEFSQQLGSVRGWDELVQRIVEYPHKVAPQAKATLFVYYADRMHMLPEATCERSGQVTLKPKLSISPDSLPIGSLQQLLKQNNVIGGGTVTTFPSGLPPVITGPLPPNRYDLLVTRNDQQIGVIKLEYPLGSGPTPEEIQALKSAAPVIALALEGALLQNLAIEQAQASENQRQHIAQNLHDTLAQNISYLRLKLDQLTGENAIREIGVVLQELERMRTTADEAYQQVRNTLDELNPIRAEDLVTMVVKQARVISERSGFSLRSSQLGVAYPLTPALRQQILYIAREALHNIEKHACAHQAHLQFLWLENGLILKITDDGVGFSPLTAPAEGHYGLWIMQHRAQEIGGSLKISPVDEQDGGTGTEVTLWVPRPVYPTAAAE